ncbi:MAG TPA: hypothetical protein VGP72_27275 [Planctomycetota bacterium]|jgi:hypothetical protein
METLPDLIREYRSILDQEHKLDERKEQLRAAILAGLTAQQRQFFSTPYGTAVQTTRFKLVPRRDPVLELLKADDLFPFASFTPAKVKQLLVPKYGRERLLPLFDTQRQTALVVKPPIGPAAAF